MSLIAVQDSLSSVASIGSPRELAQQNVHASLAYSQQHTRGEASKVIDALSQSILVVTSKEKQSARELEVLKLRVVQLEAQKSEISLVGESAKSAAGKQIEELTKNFEILSETYRSQREASRIEEETLQKTHEAALSELSSLVARLKREKQEVKEDRESKSKLVEQHLATQDQTFVATKTANQLHLQQLQHQLEGFKNPPKPPPPTEAELRQLWREFALRRRATWRRGGYG